jgi:hypothetical protein
METFIPTHPHTFFLIILDQNPDLLLLTFYRAKRICFFRTKKIANQGLVQTLFT